MLGWALRSAENKVTQAMDALQLINRIDEMNDEINRLENGYGRGPFYDGAVRDRLKSLWDERHAVGEHLRALRETE